MYGSGDDAGFCLPVLTPKFEPTSLCVMCNVVCVCVTHELTHAKERDDEHYGTSHGQ